MLIGANVFIPSTSPLYQPYAGRVVRYTCFLPATNSFYAFLQPFYISLEFILNCSFQASEERTPTALQPFFWVLLALSFLPCVSKAASFAPKIPPKSLAEGCLAVFMPLPFGKASKTPQTILCVLSRGFVRHWRKAGHENLSESVLPKPCLADEICKVLRDM